MPITVAATITKIRRRFPDMTEAVALEYLNEVHADLCRQLPFVTAIEDLTLVASQQEYALNELTVRVVSAEYFTSATGRRPLFPTDISYLNTEEPGWRSMSAGTPHRFYVDRDTSGNNAVGLLPKPVTATGATYPYVRLYVTRVATLTMADYLPEGLLTKDVYVYGAQKLFAEDNRSYQDEIPMLAQMGAMAFELERKVFDERSPYRRRMGVHGIGMGSVV